MIFRLIIIVIAVILFKKYVWPKIADKAFVRMSDEVEGISAKMRAKREELDERGRENVEAGFNPEYIPKDADKLAAMRAAKKAKKTEK